MAKLTKQEIIQGLILIGNNVELPETVKSIIDYTGKSYAENSRNVTKSDLEDVIEHLEETTGSTYEELLEKADDTLSISEAFEQAGKELEEENKPKKQKLPNKKTKVEIEDSKKTILPIKEAKDTTKKEAPKKEAKKSVHQPLELIAKLPEELDSEILNATLKVRKDLETISDVAKAFEEEQDIVIATYWTDRHLKQYKDSYDPLNINPNKPASFENDLDLIEITYVNDLVLTGCSLYSYVPQIILPESFKQDEEGIRYANGCEFQVYEVIPKEA